MTPPPAATPALPFTEATTRHLGPVRRFFLARPVAMDVVVALVFAVPAVAETLVSPPAARPDGSDPTTLILTLIALGTAVLFLRRHRPLVTAASMAFLMVTSTSLTGAMSGSDLGMALALYAVAARHPARVAWLVLLGLDLIGAAALWLWQVPIDTTQPDMTPVVATGEMVSQLRLISMSGLAVMSLAAIAIGISVRNRRLHVADLVERGNALARDRDQQAQLARAAERSRIAREMHDVVAHSLSVMIALADGAGAALERAPDRSRAALDELSATGRSALADMRRVLGVLTEDDAPLTPQPGSPDLDELVERFRTAGLAVRTQGLTDPLPADAGLQLAIYRIVQESLTNALRHAPGTSQVDLTLRSAAGQVEVEVVDHGATLPVHDAGGAGHGLVGMRERAGVYGGTIEAGPWHGGWRVRAVLPWREGAT